MRIELFSLELIVLNKRAQFVGVVGWGGCLDGSYCVVVEEAKLEAQVGDHHLYLMGCHSVRLDEIVLEDEVVRGS